MQEEVPLIRVLFELQVVEESSEGQKRVHVPQG